MFHDIRLAPTPPRRLPRLLRSILLVTALAAPGGCATGFLSYPPQARGSQVDPDQVAQLVPGTSTRQDVTALLGTPLAHASFDDNTWLYISQVTKPVIAGTQDVEAQRVYELTFDTSGVLKNVATRTKADAMPVEVVSRTTPSPGSEASLFQQLLGNIGRFGPAGAMGANNRQGSSTNPGNF